MKVCCLSLVWAPMIVSALCQTHVLVRSALHVSVAHIAHHNTYGPVPMLSCQKRRSRLSEINVQEHYLCQHGFACVWLS